eukprot:CAMPEP_0171094220 /NCGR_PEP_ID=MMETSP0766_2-20121228/40336_1 /TAXON_ID=439317 /ORGANISM="Gambierdiscus australes, Strain CAWD 149" /LENGTH=31 /DNA_ID= /DNA_START= /DNA_END= /DNA_ORIENTATION=
MGAAQAPRWPGRGESRWRRRSTATMSGVAWL